MKLKTLNGLERWGRLAIWVTHVQRPLEERYRVRMGPKKDWGLD